MRTVRREARPVPPGGQQGAAAAERGHQVDSILRAFRPVGDGFAVGRKCRIDVIRRVVGEAQGSSPGHLLYPDIQVTPAAPVGTVCQ